MQQPNRCATLCIDNTYQQKYFLSLVGLPCGAVWIPWHLLWRVDFATPCFYAMAWAVSPFFTSTTAFSIRLAISTQEMTEQTSNITFSLQEVIDEEKTEQKAVLPRKVRFSSFDCFQIEEFWNSSDVLQLISVSLSLLRIMLFSAMQGFFHKLQRGTARFGWKDVGIRCIRREIYCPN